MRALVVCTGGGIGDVLLATPVMRALRSKYDSVIALTAPEHREVLTGQDALDAVWVDDGTFPIQAARIAASGFDAAVVTWATPRSAALPFMGRVPVRVGQARRLYSALFTHRVVVRSERGDRSSHWTQILLDFARALDCDVADATPSWNVADSDRAAAAQLLAARGISEPFTILHPTRGISATAQTRWPTMRLGELGRALGERLNSAIVVSGTNSDAELASAVAHASHGVSLAGETRLAVFGALAKRARAVVAMDSGPMHVAAAVGAPTVGIFALQSDEPERWAPLGARTAVVRATYPCPPRHRKETCPDFACVANLDVDGVLAAVSGLLAGQPEA